MTDLSETLIEKNNDVRSAPGWDEMKPRAPQGNGKITDANTATGTLKLIAMVLMITDHIGAAFFNGSYAPYIPELRILGRIAFPLYAWCMALGCEYTKNIWKYLLRVLIVMVISQPVYALAMNHNWYDFSIFATLFLGLTGIAGIKLHKYGSQYIVPLAVFFVALIVPVDYGWQGVLFIMVLYLCRQNRGSLAAVMIAFCLFWGYTSGSQLTKVLGVKLPTSVSWMPKGSKFFTSIFRMQTCALLALPLMLIPMKNIRLPKWFSYSVYPAHLLLIYLTKFVLDNMDVIRTFFEKLF